MSEGFVKFVRKYYGESDIDLMSNQTNFIEFLNSVQTVYDLLKTNLNALETDRKYTVVKSFAVSITQHFFTDYLDDFNKTFNSKLTQQEFENMTDSIIFKVYLYNKYIEQTKQLMEDKNHDYGEAWRDMRMSSITDLILMKVFRVKQIEDNEGKTIISEGVDANYMDMINYSVFALIKCKN